MNLNWLPPVLGVAPLVLASQTPVPGDSEARRAIPATDGSATTSRLGDLDRVVVRANTFLTSSQDGTALATDGEDHWVVVWHSRRQEQGTYGVYARRLNPTGSPVSDETRINATVAGMQMQPCIAADDQDGIWFAWRSFQQDGDQGSIVARRFDADLFHATDEVIINETVAGHQSDPSIAALPNGRALVVWTGPTGVTGAAEDRGVFGRQLTAEGAPFGSEFRIDGPDGHASLPHIEADANGRAVVCWARTDAESGKPAGIFARLLDREGRPEGTEFRVDASNSVQPVEPTLSVAPTGEFAVAWLDLGSAGAPILWRRFRRESRKATPGPVQQRTDDSPGHTSGHAIDLDANGQLLLSWSRSEAQADAAHLFAQLFNNEDAPQGKAFPVHGPEMGNEKLAVGRGTSRARLLADGRMGFAWHGNGGLGDESGAHISVLLPASFKATPKRKSGAKLQTKPAATGGSEPAEKDAAPHEPPTFRRSDVRPRPNGSTLQLGPGGITTFLGITDTGFTPADPHMAVGPDHVVLVTNGAVAFFDTAGTLLFQDELEGLDGFFGSIGADDFVIDPEVIWDPHAERFMIVAAERANGLTLPFFLLAISDDADPNGTWHRYRVDTLTAAAGATDIDSPNIGVDDACIYLGADFPSTGDFPVLIVDKSTVLNGGAASVTDTRLTGVASPGIPITHDAGAPAQYLVRANKSALSNEVEFFAITDPLGTPVVQSTTLTLPIVYQIPEDAPQQGSSIRIETFDARFWSTVYRDGSLWATHHTGTSQVVQRWYEFDMQGWPTSGNTPSLVQVGTIDPGFPARAFFGSIAVDADGNMALLYARSAPQEFMSIRQVTRGANDPLGATQPPIEVFTSTGALSGRRGDYGACVADPDEPGLFWGHHEQAVGGAWNTRVASFRVCPLGDPFCVAATHSGGTQASIGNAGTPRVSENGFILTVEDGPANNFGIFFYGPNQVQILFGDGFRCVGGMTQRLNPVLMTNGAGAITHQVDLTTPGAAMILPDTTWNFQFWFRDPMGPGGTGFNLSNGLSVNFCE